MGTSIDALTDRMEKLEERLERLEHTCDTINERTMHVTAEHAKLEGVVTTKMESLEKRMDLFVDSINGRMDSIDRMLKALVYVGIAAASAAGFGPEIVTKLLGN